MPIQADIGQELQVQAVGENAFVPILHAKVLPIEEPKIPSTNAHPGMILKHLPGAFPEHSPGQILCLSLLPRVEGLHVVCGTFETETSLAFPSLVWIDVNAARHHLPVDASHAEPSVLLLKEIPEQHKLAFLIRRSEFCIDGQRSLWSQIVGFPALRQPASEPDHTRDRRGGKGPLQLTPRASDRD